MLAPRPVYTDCQAAQAPPAPPPPPPAALTQTRNHFPTRVMFCVNFHEGSIIRNFVRICTLRRTVSHLCLGLSLCLFTSFPDKSVEVFLRVYHTPLLPPAAPHFHNNVQCTAHIQ